MRKFFLLLFISLVIACTSEKKVKNTLEGFVFGTTYHITYIDASQSNYQKSIDSLFYLINKSLSTYIPTSDISKINNADTTVVVDAFFKEVFYKSKTIYTKTNGYFDPTVGKLVNAWGFGPKKLALKMTANAVDSMMQFVGFDKIAIKNSKIVKQQPEIYLDFNSIAKGYGVDVIGRFLESKNIENYLVEIGGEIRAKGKSNKNKNWKVAIEKPNTDGTQSIQTTVELVNQSMATSGNYRKFRISKEGKKYVHTINPKTGYATESNLLSASVISAADCADVDALATAFMAMGFEKTRAFVEKNKQLFVYLIFVDTDGSIQTYKNF
ncbi:MAG: FAD:protein FMN transferase [Flavobacteriaceae bacterium]|nr:FAD:protein FMN transferase [Flavobacteriaceae bacterium]